MLVIGVCAVLGGMRSFVAIAQWARDSIETCPQLREHLGITRVSAESTIRRTLQRLDAQELDLLLGWWAQQRTRPRDGLRVVAVDGKTLRGSGRAGAGTQRHLLAALDHAHGVVLGQVDVKTVAVADPAGPGGGGLLFPHVAQAIKVTRTRAQLTRAKTIKRTTETVYAITSLDVRDATGAKIGGFVRTLPRRKPHPPW